MLLDNMCSGKKNQKIKHGKKDREVELEKH